MNKNSMIIIGLVIGVIVGFSIGFMMNQSQITKLQSDLADSQSALSDSQSALATSLSALAASQSEVETLQGQLAEAQTNISSLTTQLTASQATVTSLENQLATKEADYSALSDEYNEFKSNITTLIISLGKKMNLEAQIIKMWVHYERLEVPEFIATLFGLGTYVDAVGDSELSTIWDDYITYYNAGEYVLADLRLADLMERNFALIQNDLVELNTLLGI